MDGKALNELLAAELARRADGHQLRVRRAADVAQPAHLRIDGQTFVNFASNDYLGLSNHPGVTQALQAALGRYPVGSGASALVTGYSRPLAEAELALARWKGAEAAVLLPSGYQAAHAGVGTLAGIARFHPPGIRFLIDKLAHASLIDAIQASSLPYRVFPHNHLEKLERLLAEAPGEQFQVVVTESIFSMDGDAADLAGLVELKRRRPFILLLDEAHGSGVYGPDGAGYAAELGLASIVDVTVVTLSKALGLIGGAICASGTFRDALINWGRAYIYSTAFPPFLAAGVSAALAVMGAEPWRRQRVRKSAHHVRSALSDAGFQLIPGDSPIVPVIYGDEARALDAAARLREAGLFVVPIRPPTVARGTSRLRITLSCEHGDRELELLLEWLKKARPDQT